MFPIIALQFQRRMHLSILLPKAKKKKTPKLQISTHINCIQSIARATTVYWWATNKFKNIQQAYTDICSRTFTAVE
jgi:hypothetical protein